MFPSVTTTQGMLMRHCRAFFQRMTPVDLQARQAKNALEYFHAYKNGIQEFSYEERVRLHMLTDQIDRISTPQYAIFNSIPWKFAKIKDTIENGFPHTQHDTIFLSNTFFEMPMASQRKTLIHEKVHVFQRRYPSITNILIVHYWKYNVIGILDSLNDLGFQLRNNPDVNNLLYSRGGHITAIVYSSKSPQTISDAKRVTMSAPIERKPSHHHTGYDAYEHPYEKMAYTIANLLMMPKYKNDLDTDMSNTLKWMDLFF